MYTKYAHPIFPMYVNVRLRSLPLITDFHAPMSTRNPYVRLFIVDLDRYFIEMKYQMMYFLTIGLLQAI